jgi:hypothetical protein
VDTVEWGSVERAGRRPPKWWDSVPRLGASVLAVAGFVLLVIAEFVPWARINLAAASTVATDNGNPAELTVTLDRVVSNESFAFQLSMIALLAAVGYTLGTSAARRRVALGTTIGVAAGNLLLVVLLGRAALHTFDTLSGFGFAPRTDTAPRLSTGPGVYLAAAGVLLLAASAVAAAGLTRFTRPAVPARPREVAAAAGAAGAGAAAAGAAAPAPAAPAEDGTLFGPDGERELTVTPLEPLDESYFARPDNR